MLENIYSSKISSDKKVREQNFLVNQIEYLLYIQKKLPLIKSEYYDKTSTKIILTKVLFSTKNI